MTDHNYMAIANDISSELVMEQAIKDKTESYMAEMADQEAGANVQAEVEEEEQEGSDVDDELDDMMDEESEKILRSYKEMRMQNIQEEYKEEQSNKTIGHGTYQEITEADFLPVVTKSVYCVVAFFHKDFERCKIVDMHLFRICGEHPEARIVRLDAEKTPFFIQKL